MQHFERPVVYSYLALHFVIEEDGFEASLKLPGIPHTPPKIEIPSMSLLIKIPFIINFMFPHWKSRFHFPNRTSLVISSELWGLWVL